MERKLTRGLEALLSKATPAPANTEGLQSIPIDSVRPNPRQPRHEFSTQGLDELKASVARDGLLQPIVVRRVGDGFELIAGERRFRACKSLGMDRIPAVIREVADEQQLVLALVENLQRRDLNAIEEALGYHALLEEFGITHEDIAKRVGKERSTVTNSMRLLDLPEPVRDEVSRGTLSAGHARALLPMVGKAGFHSLLERVRVEELSVRQTESAVRDFIRMLGGEDRGHGTHRQGKGKSPDAAIRDLEDRLRAVWGTPVHIKASRRSRSITFRCGSRDEFDQLVSRMLDPPTHTLQTRLGDSEESAVSVD